MSNEHEHQCGGPSESCLRIGCAEYGMTEDKLHQMFENLENENEKLKAMFAELERERGKLLKFKEFVHDRLDEMGVEKNPNGEHSKHGCRIGDRLDILEQKVECEKIVDDLIKKGNAVDFWVGASGWFVLVTFPDGHDTGTYTGVTMREALKKALEGMNECDEREQIAN